MMRVIAVLEGMSADAYLDQAKAMRAGMIALCRELGGSYAD